MRQNGTDRQPRIRTTQVTVQNSAQIAQVLHEERIVEVVMRTQLRGHRGSQRTVARQRGNWVTGQQKDHAVDQQCRAQENRHHHGDSARNIPAHVRP
ncbi:Uncharacterised protein [Mycobacterium tuberculosis]|uniref:Uncharacterized protein n=1 Tax=Mycobacterium tuberculosis TaxID=1773 RepID=A0A654U1X6_MYCTX|nr:Uncharacterised protein [Mycobacterium tuberculosis]CFE83813.1 Uncharacterised protein [Mycobacterium tuberculosis]CFR85156.1 Uncharacterised protein [Mycobacterium tuberculosis]CKP95847.1 Uncharacterised protein [Mycobacterium tuberculosis]CKQ75180.1 Uncharacterised protein [Mycobacterium tuberculosis]